MSPMKALLALAVAFAASAAYAGDYSFAVNRSELQTSAGVARALKRIERKAESVCGVNERRGIAARNAAGACKAEVMAHIVAEIDNPQLAAAYAGAADYAAR